MAAASGLALVGGADGNDPLAASTYGTGELISAAAGLSAAGTLFANGCNAGTLEALVAGVEAAARTLDDSERNSDINFGEWLLSELDD